MKLLKLRLENFRQHELSEVEFREGMTAIVGENGSGKTTVLEAISFALYGDVRGNNDSIKFFWTDSRRFAVTLRFEYDGKLFEVERSGTDASLREVAVERVWATGKRPTTAACERLLGLTYEQFINSFCAEQKGLTFLQFKSNPARQDEVARMLGYDRLKQAAGLANDRRKAFLERRTTLQRHLGDPRELEEQARVAEERLKEHKARTTEIQQSVKDCEAALVPARKLAEEAKQWHGFTASISEMRGKGIGLKSNVDSHRATVSEAEKQVAELKTLQPIKAQYKDLTERVQALEESFRRYQRNEELKKQADALLLESEAATRRLLELNPPDVEAATALQQAAVAAQLEATAALEAEREAWQQARKAATAEHSAAKANLTNAASALAHAKEMSSKGICPECGQPIKEDYGTVVAAREEQLRRCEAQVSTLAARVAEVEEKPKLLLQAEEAEINAKALHRQRQAELADAREKAAIAVGLREKTQAATAKRVGILEEVSGADERFDSKSLEVARAKLKDLEPSYLRCLQVSEAPAALDKAKAALAIAIDEFEAAKDACKQLEAVRAKLSFKSDEEAKVAEAALHSLEKQMDVLSSELKSSKALEAAAKRESDQVAVRLTEYKQRVKELEQIERDEVEHEVVAQELKALRVALNNELGPDLSARASENLALLTNGRYGRLVLDQNFSATVVEDDETRKAVISGGEEDIVALALRLALSELIQERQGRPMSLLILDEVFGSLDLERRQAVLDRLSALKGRFEQILVISHIEEINQVADQCLYIRLNERTRAAVVSDVPPDAFAVL